MNRLALLLGGCALLFGADAFAAGNLDSDQAPAATPPADPAATPPAKPAATPPAKPAEKPPAKPAEKPSTPRSVDEQDDDTDR